MAERKKVGVIGSGSIGRAVIAELLKRPDIEIAFVFGRDLSKLSDLGIPADTLTDSVDKAIAASADLVIEAAVPAVVSDLATRFMQQSDFCAFSCTALSDRQVEADIRRVADQTGRRFFVPHGAVLGLDGLADAGDVLEAVSITTTKSGKSLGLDPEISGVIFEGSAREACQRFPRNVNVHAAVALAGIGFDQTVSRVVAVPHQKENAHKIVATGQGLSWAIDVSSVSLGGVTGAYTPRSAVGSLQRILGGKGIAIV